MLFINKYYGYPDTHEHDHRTHFWEIGLWLKLMHIGSQVSLINHLNQLKKKRKKPERISLKWCIACMHSSIASVGRSVAGGQFVEMINHLYVSNHKSMIKFRMNELIAIPGTHIHTHTNYIIDLHVFPFTN